MAKQVGPIFILGSLGDFSFYKSGGEYLVRQKGGPDRKKILHSPRFARTRENLTEFGACSKTGAFLRRAVGRLLPVQDAYAYQRFTQLMCRIKDLDPHSARGQRKVSVGLQSPAGKALLCGFAFNEKTKLEEVLGQKPTVNERDELVLDSGKVLFPEGAHYTVISAARLRLDLDQRQVLEQSTTSCRLDKEKTNGSIRLCFDEALNKGGMLFYFVQVCFYDADGRSLNSGSLDALACVAVDPPEVKGPGIKVEGIQSKAIKRRRRRGLVKVFANTGTSGTLRTKVCEERYGPG